jgi:hypothetical protein
MAAHAFPSEVYVIGAVTNTLLPWEGKWQTAKHAEQHLKQELL